MKREEEIRNTVLEKLCGYMRVKRIIGSGAGISPLHKTFLSCADATIGASRPSPPKIQVWSFADPNYFLVENYFEVVTSAVRNWRFQALDGEGEREGLEMLFLECKKNFKSFC